MEEIDENTSMEDLQKMMAVALVYRVLVCVYEVSHISDVICNMKIMSSRVGHIYFLGMVGHF